MAQNYEITQEEKEEENSFWEYRSGKNSNNARVNDQRQQRN